LCGECNGDAANPEAGQGGSWAHAEIMQCRQHACEDDQDVDQPARKTQQRRASRGFVQPEASIEIFFALVIQENQQPDASRDGKDIGGAGPELPSH